MLKFTWKCFSLDMLFIASLVTFRAFVEVKPILFVPEDTETAVTSVQNPTSFTVANCWGFQHAQWHDSCIQSCVVSGKICAVILSITEDHVAKICSESLGVKEKDVDYHNSVSKGDMERVSRFCVYLLDKGIVENGFSWEDTMVSFLDLFLTIVVFLNSDHFWYLALDYIQSYAAKPCWCCNDAVHFKLFEAPWNHDQGMLVHIHATTTQKTQNAFTRTPELFSFSFMFFLSFCFNSLTLSFSFIEFKDLLPNEQQHSTGDVVTLIQKCNERTCWDWSEGSNWERTHI